MNLISRGSQIFSIYGSKTAGISSLMLDEDVVAVSPATTYRVLKAEGLLNRWQAPSKTRKKGFDQPLRVHDHWHIDICYVNILGTNYFLISVLDGKSRYILEHDLRLNMTQWDVQVVRQRAHEKYPDARPRIISDNGVHQHRFQKFHSAEWFHPCENSALSSAE